MLETSHHPAQSLCLSVPTYDVGKVASPSQGAVQVRPAPCKHLIRIS